MTTLSERASASIKPMPAKEQAEHRGTNRIVSDEEYGDVLRWLATNAAEIGKARQQMIYKERLRQRTEAILFLAATGSGEARKAQARASDKWLEAAEEEAAAAGEYERLRALREAAQAKHEAWRSEQASNRRGA